MRDQVWTGQGAELPFNSLGVGTHTITVTARDTDGNVASHSGPYGRACAVMRLRRRFAPSLPQLSQLGLSHTQYW